MDVTSQIFQIMKHKRHLAAILFTEMPSLPAGNEANDHVAQRRKHYHDVLTSYHEIFRGRIVNFFGNGSVSLFRCTLDAVRCAREMQQEFQAWGKGMVRMGLHVGEVLNEKEDVSGASVNLAARIQALGVPGSVLFSDIVYAQIRNQPEFEVIRLGRFPMKNITEKVYTYALKERGLVVPTRADILRYQHIPSFEFWFRAPLHSVLVLGRILQTALS